ncbi:hypothetical protein ATJ88_1281 [Isoptericola jiangsuensis]|uniref:Uncharacterized protein n=2 Tax=Isoptericola jiangsuensis TaxID=548579 RepID=A0A2A9EUR0_9MICO|nr:hypothetical protein ATJ88_1281 [Isoptericola jiangsuensis]
MTAQPAVPVDVPRPERSAGSLAWGLILLTVGGALASIDPSSVASVIGLALAVVGGLRFAVGVHRAASNLDSMAAVAYNASRRDDI